MQENFNSEKAIESLLYILNKVDSKILDFHKLFKILYFAEKMHLARYGRMITSDKFIAMKDGPVPSTIYETMKNLRNNIVDNHLIADFDNNFKIYSKYLTEAKRTTDLDYLSDSEIECLNESFKENINLDFNRLSKKSHDAAWDAARKEKAEKLLSVIDMAKDEGANDEMLKYIELNLENDLELL